MPWSPEEFKEKHNKALDDEGAEKGSKIANAILAKGEDEGSAIAIANSMVKEHKRRKATKKAKPKTFPKAK